MTIDEAIMNLNSLEESTHMEGMTSQIESIKLGIEALRRLRNNRNTKPVINLSPLPGETKE